jgi:hypothetical protein
MWCDSGHGTRQNLADIGGRAWNALTDYISEGETIRFKLEAFVLGSTIARACTPQVYKGLSRSLLSLFFSTRPFLFSQEDHLTLFMKCGLPRLSKSRRRVYDAWQRDFVPSTTLLDKPAVSQAQVQKVTHHPYTTGVA